MQGVLSSKTVLQLWEETAMSKKSITDELKDVISLDIEKVKKRVKNTKAANFQGGINISLRELDSNGWDIRRVLEAKKELLIFTMETEFSKHGIREFDIFLAEEPVVTIRFIFHIKEKG